MVFANTSTGAKVVVSLLAIDGSIVVAAFSSSVSE